jgi:TusA-related sulfurtransferase
MTETVARTLDLTNAEDVCGDSALQVVRRVLNEIAPGEVLEVRSVVAEHAFVVRAWARKTGKPILDDRTEGKETRILLKRPVDG